MNAIITKRIAARKRHLQQRLDKGNYPDDLSQPMIRGGTPRYQLSGRATGTAYSGIGLMHQLCDWPPIARAGTMIGVDLPPSVPTFFAKEMFMSKWTSLLLAGAVAACVSTAQGEEKKVPAALNFKVKTIAGKEVDLSKYQGKVVLIVNTASECGNTPQYEVLESLHEKYGKEGLSVLGFPCNQFGKQEPGSDEDIVKFCESNYKVKFDMFSKVDVNGENASPLYKYLTATDAKPRGKGKVKWNFEKFLIGRDGSVVGRFEHNTAPDDPAVIKALEAALAKK